MGKKEAFYSLPQKLAVTAFSGRRLRSKWAGDSGQGRTFRQGSGYSGSSGKAGYSGPEGRRLRPGRRLRTLSGGVPDPYPVLHHKDANELRKPGAGDSGSLGPETPVHLRGTSGPLSRTAPHKLIRQRKAGDRRLRVLWGGDSGVTGDSGPSPG